MIQLVAHIIQKEHTQIKRKNDGMKKSNFCRLSEAKNYSDSLHNTLSLNSTQLNSAVTGERENLP